MQRAKTNISIKRDSGWFIGDGAVAGLKGLSCYAKTMYFFLQNWNPNYKLSNAVLAEKLELSERTILRATKELKDLGLYYVNRTGSKSYKGYLGTVNKPAYNLYLRDKHRKDKSKEESQ